MGLIINRKQPTKQELRKAVKIACKMLDIPKSRVYVKFCDKDMDSFGGVSIVGDWAKRDKPRYQMTINLVLIKEGYQCAFETIAHEITHIKQLITGKLSYINNYESEYEIMWEGINYTKEMFRAIRIYHLNGDLKEYKKLPWEAEAYVNEKELTPIIKRQL